MSHSEQMLGELDRNRVEKAVHEYLEKRRTRMFAIGTLLIALYGVASGLVLWAVQNTGKLAGENAANEAVDRKIKSAEATIEAARQAVERHKDETIAAHARTEQLAEQTEKVHADAKHLEKEIAIATPQLTQATQNPSAASNLLSGKYQEIADGLATNEDFRVRVVESAAKKVSELDARITALQQAGPRAWAYFDTRCYTKGGGYKPRQHKISTIERVQNGIYRLTFEQPFIDSRYVALVSSVDGNARLSSNASGSIQVVCSEDTEIWVVVFGDVTPSQ